jgi:acetyl-CoA C-acetyltransferase
MAQRVCVIGVGSHTWHEISRGVDAPEPLDMWVDVVTQAAADAGAGAAAGVLAAVDALEVVYCQTWQYDDATARLAERLGITPRRRYYSGIGGTTPQQLVNASAERIIAGELDVAVVVSGEALATQKAVGKRGGEYAGSHPPAEARPFPWEGAFHPAEVAHQVLQAWLTFAIFDNARRAHRGTALDAYRHEIARMLAPMTEIAAANPEAWFPTARSVTDIEQARPDNRMVGYPYTKYMTSVMDVDMAAAVIVAGEEAADRLGVPSDRRVYLRSWSYATDPVFVAEHPELWRSPAMQATTTSVLGGAGVGIDDVAHLDLYSCFPSSLHFARDALGLADDDTRALTVTGGLPYFGGAASGYMTHSIGETVRRVRDTPRGYGLVTGVGMHMTKHVAALYSAEAGDARPPDPSLQATLDRAHPPRSIADADAAAAGNDTVTVAAYTVVHGADGAPDWGAAVCDTAADEPGAPRIYARIDDPGILEQAERDELVGRPATVRTERTETRRGQRVHNLLSAIL